MFPGSPAYVRELEALNLMDTVGPRLEVGLDDSYVLHSFNPVLCVHILNDFVVVVVVVVVPVLLGVILNCLCVCFMWRS